MDLFLASIATEEYESMASALIEMGATDKDIDAKAFARDLEKIFSSIQASIELLNACFLFYLNLFVPPYYQIQFGQPSAALLTK